MRAINEDDVIKMLSDGWRFGKYPSASTVRSLPTIEPERKGKWIRIYSRPNVLKYLGWTCSECGTRIGEEYAPQWFKYCPECGVPMEAGEQE